MKKHFILCLSLCLFLPSHPVHAWDEYKDNPNIIPSISEFKNFEDGFEYNCPTCGKIPDRFLKDWEKDKAYLEELDFHDKDKGMANCDLYYNILWQWSKKGNLSARNALFMSMYYAPLGNAIFLIPTTSQDVLSNMHNLNLLAVHQIGSDEEKNKDYRHDVDTFITKINRLTPDSKFGKCMGKERSQKCVEEAVKDGIIPSFDRFAKEIDALYAAGFMPICASGGDNHHSAATTESSEKSK